MSDAFAVINWAVLHAPTLRLGNGSPDTTAHLMLFVLAKYADKSGRTTASLGTLAQGARLTARAASEAMGRLRSAGVVSASSRGNAPVWTLDLSARRSDVEQDEDAARRERARAANAARQARYRERNAALRRDVTAHEGVTPSDSAEPSATAGEATGNAADQRYVTPRESVTSGTGKDAVTPQGDVTNAAVQRYVTPVVASQPQISTGRTALELPLNCQGAHAPATPTPDDEHPTTTTSPQPDTSTDPPKRKAAKRSTPKRKAHPLPADWEPTDAHRKRATAEGLDLDREAETFRAHAEANDRRQANWDAAFTTWLLKAPGFAGNRVAPARRPIVPPQSHDAAKAWLRQQWETAAPANITDIERRTGLRCPQPNLPPSVKTAAEVKAFNTSHYREWITANHADILARITKETPA